MPTKTLLVNCHKTDYHKTVPYDIWTTSKESHVYIGRWNWHIQINSIWRNTPIPKPITPSNLLKSLQDYRKRVLSNPKLMGLLYQLKGKILGCWCVKEPIDYVREDKDKVCHGEIILGLLYQ